MSTEPKRYIHGCWDHIFSAKQGASTVRFCYDTQKETLVAMQVETRQGWRSADRIESADVADSLETANEDALERPEVWGLVRSDVLPLWAWGAGRKRVVAIIEFDDPEGNIDEVSAAATWLESRLESPTTPSVTVTAYASIADAGAQ